MDVRMPDGTIMRNVPEDATREQILAAYEKGIADKGIQDTAQQEEESITGSKAKELAGELGVEIALSTAGQVAAAVEAEKLVVLSDTHGIFTDPKDPATLARSLNREQINGLIEKGIIDRGMLPKVQSCLRALEAGAQKAHIVDGRISHSLLLEIYTSEGVGTEIVN